MPEANENEGADPWSDIKAQNPGATTTGDITDDAKNADDDGGDTKVQDRVKAEREDFGSNAGQE